MQGTVGGQSLVSNRTARMLSAESRFLASLGMTNAKRYFYKPEARLVGRSVS